MGAWTTEKERAGTSQEMSREVFSNLVPFGYFGLQLRLVSCSAVLARLMRATVLEGTMFRKAALKLSIQARIGK